MTSRPSETIQVELDQVERQAEALRIELARAQDREGRERAYRAAAHRRRRQALESVFARLERGEWAAGEGPRIWWHSSDAPCLAPVTADEIQELESLAREGVVECGIVRRRVTA